MKLKIPPRIKVLEALGAIADGRVKKVDDHYEVISSEGDRKYTVKINDNNVYSDDNGTKFRNYIGYPIISVLMIEGKLPYDKRISEALKGIDWKKLNETYKNYFKVETIVKSICKEKGIDEEDINKFIEIVLNELRRHSFNKIA
ncbi:hypothetical protein DFR86_02430 [Acidianus sulfidivorans JP7]|uniref:Uncharacterized protein n=1 Tax=Acidianus sulfidivorans JP7 TaxID=619593 RepID=A0A2U9IKK1_9CREN|nr:hypothetical protein [Acidianus sulfidivorans]AWR96516.1 hypothetical protein DFR86_02430 [Acidianus sulfidivorans JP7]